jgi:hypothetical protein
LQAKPGRSALIHREAKGLSALLLRTEQGIPVHLLVGQKDLAVPSKGGAVEVVLVAGAPAEE